MSQPVFGAVYADAYDLVYEDKDYAAECDLIERVFREHAGAPIRSILDLGCGTGNHSIPLAQRGYDVTGVDRSESMLAHARRKASSARSDGRADFVQADIGSLRLDRQNDAALMMFAVLGYQPDNAAVLAALKAARAALRPGGLLVFDVWYGPAVLSQRPGERLRVFPTPNGRVLRAVSASLDAARHLCSVQIQVWRIEDERLVGESAETHQMRYFFPLELELFLDVSGFALRRLSAFPDLGRAPDDSTWNVLGVAQAV